MGQALMHAAVLAEPKTIELREVSRPRCGPDDVVIKVARCGICGTDVHIFNGHYSADRLPLIPGHEFAGTVDELGQNVTEIVVGQPVIADINFGCGACYFCRRNEILNCPSMRQLGIHVDGAFAEYVVVPSRLVIPLPDGMPFDLAVLTEPLACVVRSAKKIDLRFGESVLIIGAGPIGNLHVQLARTLGVAPIIVADINEKRVSLARECGADFSVSDQSALRDVVLEATDGRGADVVIEGVGAPQLYQTAFDLVRPGGRVAAFGLTDAEARLSLSPLDIVLKEIGMKGSVAGMGEDMHQALTLLKHGRIKTDHFREIERPLEQLADGIVEFMEDPDVFKIQITIQEDIGRKKHAA